MKKLQLDAASNVVHDGEAVSPHPVGAVAKLVKNILNAKNSSKIVDENGEPLVVYHQTDADFTVFDPHHPGSGTNDHHLPFGIFLKPTKSDIGMRGKKQMPLYANIKNPLVVADRNSLTQYLRENVEGYSELLNRYNNIDKEYKAKFDKASDRIRRKYTELWHQWKDGKISEDEYQRGIEDREEEAILKEWKEAGNKLSVEMKKLVDGHFRSSDYDGIILENDEGSFGRSTKTILAFDENQVKSATDNIGTFSPSNGDIRFSKPMEEVAVSPEAEAIREKDVKNIIATTSEDKLPQTRKEALTMLDGMKQPFPNDDQGYEIYVSHADAKHTMSYRNIDQIKVVGIVDKVIKNAVKIGEIPVAEDETGTKNIHLFYCPVNIDGKQYSARLVVKEYEKGNFVVDQMNLYNTQLREEKGTDKTPIQQNMPPTVLSSVPSAYKVKVLFHNTQEYDRYFFWKFAF